MWPFSKKTKPIRSTIDGATVKALLDLALRDRKSHNYRHLSQKNTLSVIFRADVDKASRKAWMPWYAERHECEDQARALVHEAQKIAANEGRSWAIGTLRASAPLGMGLHVYVWAIVLNEGRFADRDVYFYDPTAQSWVAKEALHDVDYSMT
jgi:ParB-like chromosome segregation protein Spo0J